MCIRDRVYTACLSMKSVLSEGLGSGRFIPTTCRRTLSIVEVPFPRRAGGKGNLEAASRYPAVPVRGPEIVLCDGQGEKGIERRTRGGGLWGNRGPGIVLSFDRPGEKRSGH